MEYTNERIGQRFEFQVNYKNDGNWLPVTEERMRRVLTGAYRDVDIVIEAMRLFPDKIQGDTGLALYRRNPNYKSQE